MKKIVRLTESDLTRIVKRVIKEKYLGINENPIGNIMKLEPMEYTWKKGTKEYDTFGEKEEIGFIAQQIEKIYPEIVINKKDGYLSLMYNRLTSILIEGIRHQQNDLVSVNDEISKLEILLGNE